MKVGSILENQSLEKRIAVTPEIVKKYLSLGFEILLSKDYGLHLGINDKEYLDLGAKISNDDKQRRLIAKKGKEKYMKYFNSNKVAEYIINKSLEIKSNKKFFWEN